MRKSPSMTLALWAGDRGYSRLARAVYAYWRFRNWFLGAVWDRVYPWWRRVTRPFRNTCKKHKAIDLIGDWCPLCHLVQTSKVRRLRP